MLRVFDLRKKIVKAGEKQLICVNKTKGCKVKLAKKFSEKFVVNSNMIVSKKQFYYNLIIELKVNWPENQSKILGSRIEQQRKVLQKMKISASESETNENALSIVFPNLN